MEKTFEDLYSEMQTELGDTSSAKLVAIKKWINQGITHFQTRLKIQSLEQPRTSSAVASQQQYQRPEDAMSIKSIKFYDGSRNIDLIEVPDDQKWTRMNMTVTAGVPRFWHKVGEDLYELFPIPTANYTNGIVLNCKIRQQRLYAPNYVTGTASVALNGQTITGVGTTFTAAMVGRRFRWADGSGNGVWYRISGYTSSTVITIENAYSAAAVAGQSFIIGEIPELPAILHQSLVDFAMWRHNLGARDIASAREYRSIWRSELEAYQPNEDTEEQVYNEQPEVGPFPNLMQVPENVH